MVWLTSVAGSIVPVGYDCLVFFLPGNEGAELVQALGPGVLDSAGRHHELTVIEDGIFAHALGMRWIIGRLIEMSDKHIWHRRRGATRQKQQGG